MYSSFDFINDLIIIEYLFLAVIVSIGKRFVSPMPYTSGNPTCNGLYCHCRIMRIKFILQHFNSCFDAFDLFCKFRSVNFNFFVLNN